MQSAAVDRLALKSNLDSALANDQFFLLYQPIFDLDSMGSAGWRPSCAGNTRRAGVIRPDEFIPVLEENGLILDVGRWVLHQACAQAAAGSARTADDRCRSTSPCASSASARWSTTFGRCPDGEPASTPELAYSRGHRVGPDARCRCHRLPPAPKLKEIGVMIAIDDFGSGQSSLTYLRQFPIDDSRSTVRSSPAIDGSRELGRSLHTLVELGRTSGSSIVAEGIETCAQLDGLRAQDCSYGQGFIFARPQHPNAMEPLLSPGAGPHVPPALPASVRSGHDAGPGAPSIVQLPRRLPKRPHRLPPTP